MHATTLFLTGMVNVIRHSDSGNATDRFNRADVNRIFLEVFVAWAAAIDVFPSGFTIKAELVR
jgi:hypothetical protein